MNKTMNLSANRVRLPLLSAVISAVLMTGAVHATEPASDTTTQTAEARTIGQVYASPSQVMRVQEKLRADGRKPGSNGEWNDATRAEVRDFQKAHGLSPTGQLDTSLLSALDIGDVLEGQSESGHFLDNLLKSDESVPASNASGTPIFVSPTHVAQIQHLLKEQGYYTGSIDGVWGEGTAVAANKYRAANALEASSGLDIALLRAMNAERAPVPKLAPGATARSSGVPLLAGPTALRALQKELSEQGFPTGNIDGEWGQDTQRAVREFQKEHELETTGSLTLPTLAALGIDIAHEANKAAFDAREGAPAGKDKKPDAVATDR